LTVTLNLIVIKSKNLEESVAFYEELGLQFQKEQHGKGPEHYACELDQLVFEIYPAAQQANEIRIGFNIENMERIIASLTLRGAEVITEPRVSPWGKRAVVKDPDGNSVELLEKEK